MTSKWERWSPLAGVLAVAGMLIGFAITSGNPSTDDADEKITSYYTSHSHQVRGIISFFVFIVGILFLLLFLSALRSRLVAAEGGGGRLAALAYGSGVASAAVWLGSIAFFTAPAVGTNDTGKLHLDPNTFRLTQDAAYELWVSAVIVGAIVVWATSALALRTRVLPRWFGWLGILVGVIQLFAIVFIPVFVYWGWILVAAVLLALRPAGPRPAAVPPAA